MTRGSTAILSYTHDRVPAVGKDYTRVYISHTHKCERGVNCANTAVMSANTANGVAPTAQIV